MDSFLRRSAAGVALVALGAACSSGGGGGGGGFGATAASDAGATGGTSAFGGSGGATGGTGGGGSGGVGGSAGSGGSSEPTRYWHRVTAPTGKSFSKIHGSDADHVYAIGGQGLAARFDGTAWTDVSLAQERPLNDVVAISETDVILVASQPAELFHFTGGSWQKDSQYFAVTNAYTLFASGANDVWLGTQWNFTSGPTYHFDGSGWSTEQTGTNDGVISIWSANANDAWALNSVGSILHFDGNSWKTTVSTTSANALFGTSGSDVWAVGSDVRHYDGTSWQTSSFQPPSEWSALSGVGPSELWAVGDDAGIWRYDGSGWSAVDQPGMPAGGSDIWVASPSELFVIYQGDIYYSTPDDCSATEKCDSLCIDKDVDRDHCGACNNACNSAECQAGTCVCDSPYAFCNGSCVELATDESNCGACGAACPSGGTCTNGVCGCASSQILCGSKCVYKDFDSKHCGACDNACPSGKYCSFGACSCLTGWIECNGQCFDPKTSAQSCGTCGNVCAVACENGSCIVASEVAAGALTTCARMADGSVRCWGNKSDNTATVKPQKHSGITGALLIDAGGSAYYPHLQTFCAAVASGEVLCTNYLLNTVTAVQGLTNVIDLDIGFESQWELRCALRADKTVGCWGTDDESLGDGTTWSSTTPITPTGLPPVEQISVGDFGACARTSSGQVWCWAIYTGTGAGITKPQQFGGITNAIDIAVGGDHVFAVLSDNTVRRMSVYTNGLVAGAQNVAKIASGDNSRNCVLHTDKTVSCWDSGSPTPVAGLTNIKQVTVGAQHSCAIDESGVVWCWGKNGSGQLGTGDKLEHLTPTLVAW